MNKLNRHIILFISLLAILSSCEKEIDFSGQYDSGIAVYAIAVPGEPFSMRLSRSFTVNDNPTVVFSHYSSYYSELDTLYRTVIVINNAQVEVTVNGSEKYAMTYNPVSPYAYNCDYVPKEGDNISVKVSAPGYHDITASTKIEKIQRAQIVKTEVVYKDNGDDGSIIVGNPLDRFGVDSVMSITLKINDPAGEHNFYRLRVCGVAEQELPLGTITYKQYNLSDVFTSDDIIFSDNMLTKPYSVTGRRGSAMSSMTIFLMARNILSQ